MSEFNSNLEAPADIQLVMLYHDEPILEGQEFTKQIVKLSEIPEDAVEIESKFNGMRAFKCS